MKDTYPVIGPPSMSGSDEDNTSTASFVVISPSWTSCPSEDPSDADREDRRSDFNDILDAAMDTGKVFALFTWKSRVDTACCEQNIVYEQNYLLATISLGAAVDPRTYHNRNLFNNQPRIRCRQ